jgi:hypothetical protein
LAQLEGVNDADNITSLQEETSTRQEQQTQPAFTSPVTAILQNDRAGAPSSGRAAKQATDVEPNR